MQRQPTTITQDGLPSKEEILHAAYAEQLQYAHSVRLAKRRRRPASKTILISIAIVLLIGILWFYIERHWL